MMLFYSREPEMYISSILVVEAKLTIDPFGFWVVDLELRFEQILHWQFGVTSRLIVNCKKTSQNNCKEIIVCAPYT